MDRAQVSNFAAKTPPKCLTCCSGTYRTVDGPGRLLDVLSGLAVASWTPKLGHPAGIFPAKCGSDIQVMLAKQRRLSDDKRGRIERLLAERIALRGICCAVGVKP